MHFLFAWRYFKAKKSTNAINIIAWISIVAIIIGSGALILVLSVFNGFEGIVKSLYSSFYTDLKVGPGSGKIVRISDEQLKRLDSIKGIRKYAMVVEEKGLLQNYENQSVVTLKGVDDNYRYVSGVANHIIAGNYEIGTEEEPRLVLGAGVEGALGIHADRSIQTLKVYLPRRNDSEQLDPLNDISNDTIRASSAFVIQQDFDNKYGITHIDFMKRALKLAPDEYGGIEIALYNPDETGKVARELRKIFQDGFVVQNRYQQNRSLYSVMNVERWVIYGVLCLILVVAAFNMIGALTMLVLEKQKDISVLHALGANRGFIQRIFLNEGILLAFIGAAIGMTLALVFALLQMRFHLIPLTGGSFLIDYFPVKLRVMDFILVGATVFFIAVIASWFPSRKAARQDFSLRSE